MKKKISELELYEVDFLVAKAENLSFPFIHENNCFIKNEMNWDVLYSPTINPSQAWPIIEREIIVMHKSKRQDLGKWWANINDSEGGYFGKTSLYAAMRVYVSSVYGHEVEI